jgi:N-acetylneuraminic acid mutarotase
MKKTCAIPMIITLLLLLSNGLRAQSNQPNQREPGAVPEARIYHSLVYHDKTDNILVFAGLTKRGWIGDLRDIWKYDPNTEQWKYVGICEAVSDDGKSVITTMAYDQESDQFIAVDHNGSTWAYNFKKNRWKNMNPLTSPSGRAGQGMAYDKESDRIIMFGGFGGKSIDDSVFSDTWTYDFNANQWTKMNPKLSPSARMYFAMTYDAENDKVILWGGRKKDPITDNMVWIYDYNEDSWESKENIGGPEKPLTYSVMVNRINSKDNIIFGGTVLESVYKGTLTNETWSYNLKQNKWKRLFPEVSPPPIADHNMAYDAKRNLIYLFGGELGTLYSNKLSGELWIFDSGINSWIKK